MKKYLFLVIASLCFWACDHQNDVYFSNWEGEYNVTDCITSVSQEGTPVQGSDPTTTQTTITIFRDNGLFLQSHGIGAPFNPATDPLTHTVQLFSPARMPENIEPVESDNIAHVILRNGGVITVYNGIFYAPKAIQVLSASEDQLILSTCPSFAVELFDQEGNALGSVMTYWAYKPVQKQGDNYTWEAELKIDPIQHTSSFPAYDLPVVRHTITMTKK